MLVHFECLNCHRRWEDHYENLDSFRRTQEHTYIHRIGGMQFAHSCCLEETGQENIWSPEIERFLTLKDVAARLYMVRQS